MISYVFVLFAVIATLDALSNNCLTINHLQPGNCEDVQLAGNTKSGIYQIYPKGTIYAKNGVKVFCDLSTDQGGWTVIQRQKEAAVGEEQTNFDRDWDEYASGFGQVEGSFWLGLDLIHILTSGYDQEIIFDLEDWTGERRFGRYQYFQVSNATDNYRLNMTDYSGDAGDSNLRHNRMMFTTRDRDNDLRAGSNCAVQFPGGWWFEDGMDAHPTGIYNGSGSLRQGIFWRSWHDSEYSMKSIEMKIRNRDYVCLKKAVETFGKC